MEISSDIKAYFSKIAQRLWSGHATVMVGTGFSRNAKKSDTCKKKFPLWNDLGDVFYQKINGKLPDSQKYLNVLKLADEVQAAFGRPALNQILREEIPDREYEPSSLHEKLLSLPWTDVFTTNYDTLLERAADNITSQRFDVVINNEDLVYSEKPRIIKLHGSFPSERPFIITEEDYRKYPKEYAPFVNTVQQSLLENTLCLVGFSGDDPNFLSWIGWIRDNLGKDNSPKIYLIGILNLSEAQKKLLDNKNIVTLDLSCCVNEKNNHQEALNLFLDFLQQEGKVSDSLSWPKDFIKQIFINGKEDFESKIDGIIKNWKDARVKYPNWIILPEDRRRLLNGDIEEIRLEYLSKIETSNAFDFLYEFNWRIERCLIPIYNDYISIYELIIERFNPIKSKSITKEKDTQINSSEQILKWLEIQLSMMRYYREEGYIEKWNLIDEQIKEFQNQLTSELICRLYYERCLFSLFSLKFKDIKSNINEWPVNNSLPFWEAKRAGILAELGDLNEAERILENSLKTIRLQLNLSPISNDYSYVSQEAYVMQLSKHVELKKLNSGISKSNLNLNLNYVQYNERWNYLQRYKCDPRNEFRLFDIFLNREPNIISEIEYKQNFDIGSVSVTRNYGNLANKDLMTAYSYLRFVEEIGIPFKSFNTDATIGAIKRISKYSPFWAIATLIRTGDGKIADTIFNRKSVYKMDLQTIDELIKEYLEILDISFNEIKKESIDKKLSFAKTIAGIIPEILSRLCVRTSFETRIKILDFLKILYQSEQKGYFKNINKCIGRLITTYTVEEQYKLIPVLLEFPLIYNTRTSYEDSYVDPLIYLNIKKIIKGGLVYTKSQGVNSNIFDDILSFAKQKDEQRHKAIYRLNILIDLNLLSNNQKNRFGDVLWSQTDEITGLPKDTDIYNYIFLELPHPKTINPKELFKKYILETQLPLHKENGVSMTSGNIPLLLDIIYSKKFIQWENKEICLIFEKLVSWFDSGKEFLREKDSPSIFGSIQDEFKARFKIISEILIGVILPELHFDTNREQVKILERIINEYEIYGLSNLKLKAASIKFFLESEDKIYERIERQMLSYDKEIISDAIDSLGILLNIGTENEKSKLVNLLHDVSIQIMCRNKYNLISFINLIMKVFNNNKDLLDVYILKNIRLGIENILEETNIDVKDTAEEVDVKLLTRQGGAYLSVYLYNYYNEKNRKIHPSILKWKKVSLDENEFLEIRNIWIDNIIKKEKND